MKYEDKLMNVYFSVEIDKQMNILLIYIYFFQLLSEQRTVNVRRLRNGCAAAASSTLAISLVLKDSNFFFALVNTKWFIPIVAEM